ncbi:MAG: phenylalanine--tRNA ligase subunit beta [Desulfurococcaceae archaeon]
MVEFKTGIRVREMPVVRIRRSDLEELLGTELNDLELHKLLARLKCEVELIDGDIIEYEANSDRPDLFSSEGLSRALKPWLGLNWRSFTVVESSVKGYADYIPERPYLALAVVRDIRLTSEAISQIMQLQEKITQTYGRARRKISIGVYDLDALKPPIYYEAADPDLTRFRPLGSDKPMTLREILETTEKGILYGHIVKNMSKYLILRDAEGNILSLTPIINSEDCRVRTDTKNVIIDATGTSVQEVVNAITIMATSIVERSSTGAVESVKVYHKDNLVVEAPMRERQTIRVNANDVNGLLGTSLNVEEITSLLQLFYYEVGKDTEYEIVVRPPLYRVDVRTWVDVAEDVAIAYGYEKIGAEADSLPASGSIGRLHPVEYVSRRLRDVLIGLGFQEVANYMMSNRATQLEMLNYPGSMFSVQNPRSERFEGLRVWLAPQLLDVVKENAEKYNRVMIFEIGDVAIPDLRYETQARIERRLGIAIYYDRATLTDGLAYVKAVLNELEINHEFVKGHLPGFLPERTAVVKSGEEELGFVGEIYPGITYELGLKNPVVIAELYLDRIKI